MQALALAFLITRPVSIPAVLRPGMRMSHVDVTKLRNFGRMWKDGARDWSTVVVVVVPAKVNRHGTVVSEFLRNDLYLILVIFEHQ